MVEFLVKSFFILVVFLPFSMNGQYSVKLERFSSVYPLPNEGVVEVETKEGYVDQVSIYNASGQVGSVTELPSELVGDYGDFVLSGQELFVTPAYLDQIDIGSDIGFVLLNVSTDSVSVIYKSPEQLENIIAIKALGIGSSTGNLAISEGDSVHILTPEGILLNSIALPEVFLYNKVLDLSNSNSSYEFALVCQPFASSQSSTIYYLDSQGVVVDTERYSSRFLDSWIYNGVPFLFFEDGYMVLEAGSLTSYPSSMGEIVAAYDAVDVAVLRNSENQYFSYTPSGGFVAISDPGQVIFKRIYKRPAGWYTLVNGILTFDPNTLSAPPANPLRLEIIADSALTRVDYTGLNNTIPITTYIISYTLGLTNTSSEPASAAEIELIGPFLSYDPFNRSAYTEIKRFENIQPGETSTTSGVYTYTLNGNLPEPRAAVYGCLISLNDGPTVPGEELCDYDVTAQVSDNKELSQFNSLQVYPNPIERAFVLASQERVKSLSLVNVMGQVVQQFEGNSSNSYQLSNDVSPGLYTLQVQSNTGEKSTVKVFVHQ